MKRTTHTIAILLTTTMQKMCANPTGCRHDSKQSIHLQDLVYSRQVHAAVTQ